MFFRPWPRRDGPGEAVAVRVSPGAVELVRLESLLEVVAHAVELQAEAEEVLWRCSRPGDTPGSVARQGQRVAADYVRLLGWAMDLCAADAAGSLPHRIIQLLRYHTEIIDIALKLAFPRYRSPRLERRRRALTALGPPAQILRDAEAALRLWIAELPEEG